MGDVRSGGRKEGKERMSVGESVGWETNNNECRVRQMAEEEEEELPQLFVV